MVHTLYVFALVSLLYVFDSSLNHGFNTD